tara:strand:- start:234 stop:671 length:438 start_codon:yes stop_codon:yes gene_type:complete
MSTIEGLKRVEKLKEDSNWISVGDDINFAYFKTKQKQYPKLKHPGHFENCECDHPIQQNCYIYNIDTHQSMVVGNKCITGFTGTGIRKTCSTCGNSHQNRKDDFCNDCRKTQPKKIRYRDCCGCGMEIKFVVRRPRCMMCWEMRC